ncbi:Sorbin and SH3 domain-containing protein 1 [Portunus trituberculatus]|uniref:Sorbin and SH3 domain-containing protein 1 n=1 Tax=Portunus trituberculatus TaxID=210409 RepID=A0A5B7E1Q1_PORTR|nr:Sorbin and SH3 domain-containing protein 1 [Portunus trituberculatus]
MGTSIHFSVCPNSSPASLANFQTFLCTLLFSSLLTLGGCGQHAGPGVPQCVSPGAAHSGRRVPTRLCAVPSCSSHKMPYIRESPYKYESGEVNIHYRTPVRIEQKESIPEEELARRQEEHMKKVYENERRKKYLAELEDIERRRHTDNFTPLQKSPIPLNRYDDESSLGTMRGVRTPDLKQVAKALYNFSAQNKREISFNKGDVVFIRRQIDKNWYEGEHRGSVGIFPCNYVEIVPYDSIRTLTRKPTEGQARARFNFQAQTSMEMSLSKGELVVLTRRVDENWYEGRIGNRKGIFPVSYVDTLMEPGADRPCKYLF